MRIHLTDCRTIDSMKRRNRFERYIGSQNRDGEFKVNVYIDENRNQAESTEITTKLMTCKNCLDEINYNNYSDSNRSDRNQIWSEFNLNDYFDKFSTYFREVPIHTCATIPLDDYPEDWSEISRNLREERGYTCEECGLNLSRHMYYLHTHHIDHVLHNVNPQNLKALCIICHSNKPGHESMHVSDVVRSIITRLRLEQGI